MHRDLATLLIARDIVFAEYQITIEDGRDRKRVVRGGNLAPSRVQVAAPAELRLQELQPEPQIGTNEMRIGMDVKC
jgi:hypothetical protein